MSASRGDQAELIQIPVVCDFSDDGAEDDSPVEADRTPPPQRCPADAICDSTVDAPGTSRGRRPAVTIARRRNASDALAR